MGKTCTSCKYEKDLSQFAKGGAHCWCDDCRLAYHRDYYHKNKQIIKIKQAEKHKQNMQDSEYRKKHNANSRKWREANRDKALAAKTAWRKRNPERHRIHEATRRARKAGAKGIFTVGDAEILMLNQKQSCFYCDAHLEDNYHIDHMLPLSRGGSHDPLNIAITCVSCNLTKHTKTAEEFWEARHRQGS